MKLKRWRNAWKLCDRMDDIDAWNKLGEEAMRSVDMELAIRVYRKIGKASMVSALEDLKDIEEENLLSGHLMALLGEFDKADELFCLSSEPLQALDVSVVYIIDSCTVVDEKKYFGLGQSIKVGSGNGQRSTTICVIRVCYST